MQFSLDHKILSHALAQCLCHCTFSVCWFIVHFDHWFLFHVYIHVGPGGDMCSTRAQITNKTEPFTEAMQAYTKPALINTANFHCVRMLFAESVWFVQQ